MKYYAALLILFACNPSPNPVSSMKQELIGIYQKDQFYREELTKSSANWHLWKKQDSLDAINLKRVTFILDSMGNPSRKLFGDTASLACFLVIQHADSAAQEKYLPVFEQAAKAGDLQWKDVVKMVDRLQLAKSGTQRYGTQYAPIKDPKTGYNTDKYQLSPIEDERNVDKRRQEVGLPPLATDAKKLGVDYIPPADTNHLH
ncbi:hypothetical protein CLV59_10282 [Chitinophaga dinghuensis]|uniref:Uncharacterized protein n=1 Tax=Chitinophaga dinghuensis TaxID=1539050 RepID=A0A327W5V5_9BACT|nr:DUF6624 domain-containing protein [Chitinophaga dinghuensis]RAJ85380.1 hypothetical protein CLV59_10282 [Chitinophaga dinghuensis]